jgi:hypothetical protein
MRKLLPVLLLASLASSAPANPMLDKCLSYAPPVCGLTDKSETAAFLSCFEAVTLDAAKPGEGSCAEELAHARVHKSCGADIPKVCAKVKPGGNRTMNCLRRNSKKLSGDCQKELEAYDGIVLPATKGGERKKGRGAGVSAVRC